MKGALREYIDHYGLQADREGEVRLDQLMLRSLFNKKESVIEGNPHPISDVERRLFSNLQLFHLAHRSDSQVGPSLDFLATYSGNRAEASELPKIYVFSRVYPWKFHKGIFCGSPNRQKYSGVLCEMTII